MRGMSRVTRLYDWYQLCWYPLAKYVEVRSAEKDRGACAFTREYSQSLICDLW